jgi:hypothetical protein
MHGDEKLYVGQSLPGRRCPSAQNLKRMKVIGLCGKPKAGKNAVAEITAGLVPGTVILNFSEPIIGECAKLLSVEPEIIEADKEYYRPFMQWYGYDHKRREDEEYWVRKIEAKLDEAEEAGAPLAVVCGVRAINEWVMIVRRGGVVYEVIRGAQEWTPACEHPCENQKIPTNGTIKNLGGLGELCKRVEPLVRRVMEPKRPGFPPFANAAKEAR